MTLTKYLASNVMKRKGEGARMAADAWENTQQNQKAKSIVTWAVGGKGKDGLRLYRHVVRRLKKKKTREIIMW